MGSIDLSLQGRLFSSANDQNYNHDLNIDCLDNPDSNSWSKYDLKGAVKLPELEKCDEWIANNLFDFHKQLCMLFGTVCDHCTRDGCPNITAGDSELSASDYITLALDWIQEQLDDEEIFPTMAEPFPTNFTRICEVISRRLFRVYAHIYNHHLTHVRAAKLESHMNTSLKHFIFFCKEFNLIKEWVPLQDLVSKLDKIPSNE